jgi:DNA-binding SARP family transcriptional activator
MTILDFRVLGPVSALRDGAEIALGGPKRRALLARLVASANRVVSVESIVDDLWGEEPPPSATTSIHVMVSALRTALDAPVGSGGAVINTVRPGYRLTLGGDQSDLLRFRARRDEGMAARADGDLRGAGRLLREALGEWSGPAYADLRDLRFAEELAVHLEEERLAALEGRVEVDLGLGEHRSLLPELAALTREHPLRESLWGHYIVTLYRCGRQADALAAYRELRETLADELGIDPGTDLRRLESAVLDQDPALDWHPGGQPVPAPPTEREAFGLDPALLEGADGSELAVPASGLRIGRDPGNDLVLTHPRVSRQHAALVAGPAGYVLVDLHSTNGTRVNGERLSGERLLEPGDAIGIGDSTYVLRLR